MGIDATVLGNIGRAYLDESRREDFVSQIEQWEDIGRLTSEEYEKLKADPAVPDRIDSALSKNDYYWENYWESVSEVAHEIVNRYMKDREDNWNVC